MCGSNYDANRVWSACWMVEKKRCGGVGVSEYGVVLLLDGGDGGVKGESRTWFLCQSFKLF